MHEQFIGLDTGGEFYLSIREVAFSCSFEASLYPHKKRGTYQMTGVSIYDLYSVASPV